MKTRCLLLPRAVVLVCLLAVGLSPAAAYIKVPPQTLGSLCLQAEHISVLRVEKVSVENGVIIFKHVEELKGTHDGSAMRHVIKPDVKGAKVILDGAAEGKTAVMFYFTGGNDRGHVCIDGYWYWVYGQKSNAGGKGIPPEVTWFAFQGEPALLTRYCGSPEQLRDAVVKILKGEEVVVPAMAGEDVKALEERRGKVGDVRASLKIVQAGALSDVDRAKLLGKPADKKPQPGDKNAEVRKPDRIGTVKALAADGKSFTLQPLPNEKIKEPAPIEIQITEGTKIVADKESGKLAVGQTVSVWLQQQKGGSTNIAEGIQIGKPADPPEKKPTPPARKPEDKGKTPAPDAPEKKPEPPAKPKEPAKPPRDPAPTAGVIDAEINRHLAAVMVPASPQADDAEFLRRVTLDLTGRIPTYQQTVDFLDSKDPDKRRKLIDELLDSPEYGEHFATIWRNLLVGRDNPLMLKGTGTDALRPWLAEQFNTNRGWNAIVTDLLTAEGTPTTNPATAFLLANGENGQPRPNKVTGAAAALFWGVNLRCAECHNHPYAAWKQSDFWGTAAFFGKLQYAGGKAGPASLTESPTAAVPPKVKGQADSPRLRGTAIVIPAGSGKAAGQVVNARFLGGDEPALDEKEPFRPRFAAWATAADNPYFAKAAVNRTWAHFFGRGFVNPLDAFDTGTPSHPELLERLAKEFASSGFDLKHLARCITTSKAYQRTSRPVPGNEADLTAFSHMSVKVLTPEVLYDSLGVIGKGGGIPGKGGEKQEPREQFLRSFRVDEDASPTEYIQGIPEMLRLMNVSTPNRGAALVDKLCSSRASHTEAVTTLYLTVLSRRPTPDEVELMEGYLSRRKDDREGYRGVLWILLNSSEFALNH